jgi:hypothetical protein
VAIIGLGILHRILYYTILHLTLLSRHTSLGLSNDNLAGIQLYSNQFRKRQTQNTAGVIPSRLPSPFATPATPAMPSSCFEAVHPPSKLITHAITHAWQPASSSSSASPRPQREQPWRRLERAGPNTAAKTPS